MKPIDGNGQELDAIFTVQPADFGAYLILESRGGGEGGPRPPRNADYAQALELLLGRLGQSGASLSEIEVHSRVALGLPIDQRRIAPEGYSLPIDLSALQDFERFRIELGKASAAFGQAEASIGGNRTKKLRFKLEWRLAIGRTSIELEELLATGNQEPAGPNEGQASDYDPLGAFLRGQTTSTIQLALREIASILGRPLPATAWTPQFWANVREHHLSRRGQWLNAGYEAFFQRQSESVLFKRVLEENVFSEDPTDDPETLKQRIGAAKARMLSGDGKLPDPPSGSSHVDQKSALTTRYVRDPKVVAWVLIAAGGKCECCSNPAPFSDSGGEPFLEVHHVDPLGDGGPDVTDNAVAVCPNCHRHLQFGEDRERLRAEVIAGVARLKDYRSKPD